MKLHLFYSDRAYFNTHVSFAFAQLCRPTIIIAQFSLCVDNSLLQITP